MALPSVPLSRAEIPQGVTRYLAEDASNPHWHPGQAPVDPWWFFCAARVRYLSLTDALRFYRYTDELGDDRHKAILGLCDRYYLLLRLMHRTDVLLHGVKGSLWLYARCREVEAEPEGRLDLWARDHYKSTIITIAGSIQEVLRDPEITIAIFGGTNKVAKPFLGMIMREFASNRDLKRVYSDVLWADPEREAPLWGVQNGIIVKRRTNPVEATIEAHGLVDGMPVGRHYGLRIYDDLVTEKLVSTPDMIAKVTERWELSDNLGRRDGRVWHIGTRYTYSDTYGVILDRGVVIPRIHAATDNGRLTGFPVFFSEAEWERKKRTQGAKTVAAQLLQNPLAGVDVTFDLRWFQQWTVRPFTVSVFILVDPSKGRTHRSDYTAMCVWAMDAGGNLYLVDGFRHRMRLSERLKMVRLLHGKWKRQPGVIDVRVGYEQYAMQTDIEAFEMEQKRKPKLAQVYLEEVAWPRKGEHSKNDRIERLQPDARNGKIFLPGLVQHSAKGLCTWKVGETHLEYAPLRGTLRAQREARERGQAHLCAAAIKQRNEQNELYDLTLAFLDEAREHPFGRRDDLLDAASRVYDLDPVPPVHTDSGQWAPQVYTDGV